MPCPIQIRETIQKSIDRKLPDSEAVMSQDAAKGIVDYLNKLWSSAITRIQQYSGLGGARVIVNSLDDAVNKEFKRQEDAEKAFERDLDFFKGDEALMQQEEKDDLLLQKSESLCFLRVHCLLSSFLPIHIISKLIIFLHLFLRLPVYSFIIFGITDIDCLSINSLGIVILWIFCNSSNNAFIDL
jgi:hypothetical protein